MIRQSDDAGGIPGWTRTGVEFNSMLEGVVVMCAPLSTAEVRADAVRLLEQATFGPTDALIAQAAPQGAAAFVDAQLALPSTRYTTCVNDPTPPLTATSYCQRDNYTLFPLQREFFVHALLAPDQLRQRVAFALSQLLVTSATEINQVYGMQRHQQMLADLAFANFEVLLTQVTLSPAMGRYLFYPPHYVVPGTSALGPEFGTQNTASTLARINTLNVLAFVPSIAPDPTVYAATGTTFNWSALTATAALGTEALLARLDESLLHGRLSAAAKAAIATAVNAIPSTDPLARARTAFYLATTSPNLGKFATGDLGFMS